MNVAKIYHYRYNLPNNNINYYKINFNKKVKIYHFFAKYSKKKM